MPLSQPQTDAARLAPYIEDIRKAAEERDLSPYLLAAVCLRESQAGWALIPHGTHLGWGDNFRAWGLFQADRRFHGDWVGTPDSLTPVGQARKAADEIARNLALLRASLASQPDDLLQRGAIAAYNTDLGNVVSALLSGRDVDALTTGANYSADVLTRAAALTRQGLFMAHIG
jgi:hypothetical protein